MLRANLATTERLLDENRGIPYALSIVDLMFPSQYPLQYNSWTTRELRIVVSSGIGPLNESFASTRNGVVSYNASSIAGSLSAYPFCSRWIRSMVSSGYGGRPRPATGYGGSIDFGNKVHGIT
jgi:hypothetical protein